MVFVDFLMIFVKFAIKIANHPKSQLFVLKQRMKYEQNLESDLLYQQKNMWKVLVLYESLFKKIVFFFGPTLTSLFQNKTMPVFVT